MRPSPGNDAEPPLRTRETTPRLSRIAVMATAARRIEESDWGERAQARILYETACWILTGRGPETRRLPVKVETRQETENESHS